MTAGNEFDPEVAEPTLFSALLTPHRSLNRTGFLVLMAFLSLISFAAGVAFLLMGAWPVFGFFGLDVLAIYWAFKINFRRARACEEIRVTPSELRVRRVSHRCGIKIPCAARLPSRRSTGARSPPSNLSRTLRA